MVRVAAITLSDYVTDEELNKGLLYPSIHTIRDLSGSIASSVIEHAKTTNPSKRLGSPLKEFEDGLKETPLTSESKPDYKKLVKEWMYDPKYTQESK